MKKNKINFQTVSTLTKTFQTLRHLSSMDWHVLEGAAKMARLGQIPKVFEMDVWVKALIPKGSSVCQLCSESRDTWGAVTSCWGVGEQWPSISCLQGVIVLCLFWPLRFGSFAGVLQSDALCHKSQTCNKNQACRKAQFLLRCLSSKALSFRQFRQQPSFCTNYAAIFTLSSFQHIFQSCMLFFIAPWG